MAITGHWSAYAIDNALNFATGRGAVAPTTFTARLYSDQANPDAGATTELTVAGYAPVTGATWDLDLSANTLTNHAKLDWSSMSAATIGGIAVTDDGSGHILWYANVSASTTAGGGAIVPAGGFIVKIVGL